MRRSKEQTRVDTDLIFGLIPESARVLDIGCGDGRLLKQLIAKKKVTGCAVEISESNIAECVEKGIDVCHEDVDEGLHDFESAAFDYVILNQTLQVVRKPDLVIKEMLRIGKKGIVGFPNFGYWRLRFQLLFNGRMPVTAHLPFRWYNTPNIHMLTHRDFNDFCKKEGISILRQINIVTGGMGKGSIVRFCPNLFSETSLFVLEKRGTHF